MSSWEPLFFVVHGPPVTKSRVRGRRTGVYYTPAATRAHEARIGAAARAALSGEPPWMNAKLEVIVRLFWPSKRTCDVDNGAKAVLDGLNKIAYHDDRQVFRLTVEHHFDKEHPRTEVAVTPLIGLV